jgi:hypothetical protein
VTESPAATSRTPGALAVESGMLALKRLVFGPVSVSSRL